MQSLSFLRPLRMSHRNFSYSMRIFVILILFQLFQMLLSGCASIAPFSQRAYEQAVDLKVDALHTMELARDSFVTHQAEVSELKLKVEKAYEYAKGRPDNELSSAQWKIVIDTNEASLFTFFKRWENKKILAPVYIEEKKSQIAEHFDLIIGLESGKEKK